ncbi:hypothetical protein THF5H11_10769 [Vibrio jasicida]|nr:hypothetical protein THF5H11_10769 [Vibrio jasicida]
MTRLNIIIFGTAIVSGCSTTELSANISKPSSIIEQNIFVTSWGQPVDLDSIECFKDWVPFILQTKQHSNGRKVSIVKCIPSNA